MFTYDSDEQTRSLITHTIQQTRESGFKIAPVDIPVGEHIVRVANRRQRALPDDVRPLVEPVRAELVARGVRTATTAIPENTDLTKVRFEGRTQFTDLPPVMRERFTSLAGELWP